MNGERSKDLPKYSGIKPRGWSLALQTEREWNRNVTVTHHKLEIHFKVESVH